MYYLCTLKFPPPLSPSLSISNFLPLRCHERLRRGFPEGRVRRGCFGEGQEKEFRRGAGEGVSGVGWAEEVVREGRVRSGREE